MNDEISWDCRHFDQLDSNELYCILQLRTEVFVLEQDCVYQDMDGMDQQAYHLSGTVDGQLRFYARLFPPGIKYPQASIGRVISSDAARGKGYGRALMNAAVENCMRLWPDKDIAISAQQHLEDFYQSVGFETASEPYMEDGIPHIQMRTKAHG